MKEKEPCFICRSVRNRSELVSYDNHLVHKHHIKNSPTGGEGGKNDTAQVQDRKS
jgi:hypothetical protein